MAFHVTQCPGCDSTFNTSARLLGSAHGRVRCGACLTVFDAVENFIDQSQSHDDQASEESVFVGNNPLDYFDPSSFLTRAALTEDEKFDGEDEESVIEEQTSDLIESTIDIPEQAQFNQDFFRAIADELQQPPEPAELMPLDSTQTIPADTVTPAVTDDQGSESPGAVTDSQNYAAPEPEQTPDLESFADAEAEEFPEASAAHDELTRLEQGASDG